MVFLDFTQQNEKPSVHDLKIAPVSDRLLAFFFDVVIFSPILSLILSQLLKKIELRYYTSPESMEFYVLVGVSVALGLFFVIITQALFITYWNATPGKMFFKLKVIPLHGSGKVRFPQALLRSGLWSLEVLFLMIPFVEVLSHHYRRPLHDRASDTMVITLKEQGDLGPHPMETHFVRTMLFILVCGVLFWSSLIVTQFYRMAERGEFKRHELEEEQYLCASITAQVDDEENRLDYAIARYLAGEVGEKCLLAEADFALWQSEKDIQAWAYLAKAIHYQYDDEKSDLYLDKVCETENQGEPCFLSQALQHENVRLKKKTSLTAMMLSLKQQSRQGDYQDYLQELKNLSQFPGFEHFVQKEIVKALWIAGEAEKSKGALWGIWSGLDIQDQVEIGAWLCQEELDQKCGNIEYQSCQNLKETLAENRYEDMTQEAAISVVQERECKKTSEPSLLVFHSTFEDNPELKLFVGALSSESPWTSEKRIQVMRDLAFSSRGSKLIQKRALFYLSQKSNSEKDFQKIYEWLAKNTDHNWMWNKIYKQSELSGTKLKLDQYVNNLKILKEGSIRLPASEVTK
ncbi:MAG: hypothetical protein BroJett040_24770 [Oligoflexia bacterium]|nr:MAG: hypothetical protein BroJett040_24770 [Oligoflexia bacterium]